MALQNSLLLNTNGKKTPLLHKVLVVLAIMTVMGGLLTGIMTYMNVGYTSSFFVDWSKALLSAFAVMPIGILLIGLITKGVNRLLPDMKAHKRNLIVGVLMACAMESMLAFSTATNTIGFSDTAAFLHGWLVGFLAALPVGVTLMIIISLTIKPKIETFLKS